MDANTEDPGAEEAQEVKVPIEAIQVIDPEVVASEHAFLRYPELGGSIC